MPRRSLRSSGLWGRSLVLVPRGRIAPLAGFLLLGLGTLGLARSLVGYHDIDLLLTQPKGIALVAVGVAAAICGAVALARYPAVVPVVLLAAAPFRIPVGVGDQDAFLLLPLYLVLTSAVLALAYRLVRDSARRPPPLLLGLPTAAFVAFTAVSFLWTWDTHEGGITLAFFVFPFVAGFGVLARSPLASWLPRALVVTLVALGSVFAAVGLWQSHTHRLFFARDLEVANAYTTFFRVTSLFKDPSLYGRYLVVPIAILLVILLLRQTRPLEWTGSPRSWRSSSRVSTSPTRSRASSRSSWSPSGSRSSPPITGSGSRSSCARASRRSARARTQPTRSRAVR